MSLTMFAVRADLTRHSFQHCVSSNISWQSSWCSGIICLCNKSSLLEKLLKSGFGVFVCYLGKWLAVISLHITFSKSLTDIWGWASALKAVLWISLLFSSVHCSSYFIWSSNQIIVSHLQNSDTQKNMCLTEIYIFYFKLFSVWWKVICDCAQCDMCTMTGFF